MIIKSIKTTSIFESLDSVWLWLQGGITQCLILSLLPCDPSVADTTNQSRRGNTINLSVSVLSLEWLCVALLVITAGTPRPINCHEIKL